MRSSRHIYAVSLCQLQKRVKIGSAAAVVAGALPGARAGTSWAPGVSDRYRFFRLNDAGQTPVSRSGSGDNLPYPKILM